MMGAIAYGDGTNDGISDNHIPKLDYLRNWKSTHKAFEQPEILKDSELTSLHDIDVEIILAISLVLILSEPHIEDKNSMVSACNKTMKSARQTVYLILHGSKMAIGELSPYHHYKQKITDENRADMEIILFLKDAS